MMTVARRNRSWTPDIIADLSNAVEAHIKKGNSKTSAFQMLANRMGASPATLSNVYYTHIHAKASTPPKRVLMTKAKAKVKGPVQQTHSPTVQQAIDTLKSMGFTITLTI